MGRVENHSILIAQVGKGSYITTRYAVLGDQVIEEEGIPRYQLDETDA